MDKYISYSPIPWLLPGGITPYAGVFSLVPNHELCFNTGRIKRFLPRKNHGSLSVNEAMEYIANNIKNQMITLNKYHKQMVQMTKGNDSRIDFSVKGKNVYTTQIGLCTNYADNAEKSENKGYYVKIDSEVVYRNDNLKGFFNKENQINVVKYFETGGIHTIKIKIGLFSKNAFTSVLGSAGIIHIESVKVIYSTHIYKIPEKTVVITSWDLFREMNLNI